jgi:hypothetical protein
MIKIVIPFYLHTLTNPPRHPQNHKPTTPKLVT